MNQNDLAISKNAFEKVATYREDKQVTYLCYTFSHIQHDFVPKYDYF